MVIDEVNWKPERCVFVWQEWTVLLVKYTKLLGVLLVSRSLIAVGVVLTG